MKKYPFTDEVEEQAALWAARLDGGGLTERDQGELAAWLNAQPAHRSALESYRSLSATLTTQLEAMHCRARERMRRERLARRRTFLAAMGVLATAAARAIAFLWHAHRPQHYATATGQRRTDVLEDGTRMELNAETALSVSFGRNARHVRLEQGEALFTVSRDAARPFLVDTSAGQVRVTGTVFNVRTTAAARTEVTVLEGSVRVNATARSHAETPLVRGQRLTIDVADVEVVTLAPEALDDVVAWREGKAVFNDEPLAAVIERFSAYHRRTIEVAPAAGLHRVGGRYALDDLEGLLESLEVLLPVRIVHESDGRVQILAREEPNPP